MTNAGLVIALMAGTAALSGCSTGLLSKSAERVEPEQFSSGARAGAASGTAPGEIPKGVAVKGEAEAREGVGPLRTAVGAPRVVNPASSAAAAEEGERQMLVDAKVGDFNGKPVFASAFLEEYGPRLAVLATDYVRRNPRTARETWRGEAGKLINDRLNGMLRDELLRAEALASLKPEVKQGLATFVQSLQQSEVSRYRGSEAEANQSLLGTTGMTLKEFADQQLRAELIRYQLQTAIRQRVHVSWREITQYYEREEELFNPKPRAVFRVIQVPKGRTEDVVAVTELLTREPFEKVAAQPLNRFSRQTAEFAIEKSFAESKFFGTPKLTEAAGGLQAGQTAGPIEVGDMVWWINLEAILQGRSALYDMQLYVEDVLKDERTSKAAGKYFERLSGRASHTDTEVMTARLLFIAEQRIFDPALAAAPRPAAPR